MINSINECLYVDLYVLELKLFSKLNAYTRFKAVGACNPVPARDDD